MRRVGLTDLDLAARAVMGVTPEARLGLAASMLEAAHVADKLRKRLGRPVAGFGDGSLASEAIHLVNAAGRRNGPDYIKALGVVVDALRARQQALCCQPRTQDKQRGKAGTSSCSTPTSSAAQPVQ